MEMWWLFTTLMRDPREIFDVGWAAPFGWFFTYVVPVLLVVYVPAEALARRVLDPWFVTWMLAATAFLLVLSRRFFRRALQSYRSASS
jgi:ABC-2 type transport system permease protein